MKLVAKLIGFLSPSNSSIRIAVTPRIILWVTLAIGLLPKSLLPQPTNNKIWREHRPTVGIGTNPAIKAGQRPPAIQDEWAKEPE